MSLFGKKNNINPHVSTYSNDAGNRSNNRTNWPGRYAGPTGSVRVNNGPLPRWVPAVVAVLIIGVLLLGVFGIPAITFRSQSENTFINRMLTECDDALTLAGNLSRNGGADSAATLGRIRSDIHAIDVINDMRSTLGGGHYVEPYVFTNLYSIIDSYSANLRLGNVTMQNLTDLVQALEALQATLNGLR